jgi:hypothetical protein
MPLVRNLPCKHPQGDAYFQFTRNMVKGMAKNFPAPPKCVDAVEAATQKKFEDGKKVTLSPKESTDYERVIQYLKQGVMDIY